MDADRFVPVDRGRGRVHRDDPACIADLAQIAEHAVALRLPRCRGADHRNYTRPKQRLHITLRHGLPMHGHGPFATQISAQFGCSLKEMSNCLSRLAKRVEIAL